ncbi:HAD family hydrolase [Clostridium lundense]|uniref:HAD family hydrolase n=1 Tax=Clostridium lundense TaxID=319475 RepID=UPI000484BA6D|nr:HAD family hydrolase [Clostridium lundense]
MNISAILWDYDGTLVDTTRKNMAVTIKVLKNFIPDVYNNMPEALISIENYQKANYRYRNWKELYKNCYGLNDEQINEAGKLWSPYQLKDTTLPNMFVGLSDVIEELGHIKHGICSQNCSKNIYNTLKNFGIAKYFGAIIGYEDIPYDEQKPNPSGFLKCLEKLNISPNKSIIIYIGDHQEDTIFGKNAAKYYKLNKYDVEIICIAARYSGHSTEDWSVQPDFVAYCTSDILNIINSIQGM